MNYDDGSASSFSSYDVEEKGERGKVVRGDSSFDLSSNDGETEATTKTDSKEIVLGQRETRWLSKARLFMAFILLVATAAFATGTHVFMKKIEQDDFTTRVSRLAKPKAFCPSSFIMCTQLTNSLPLLWCNSTSTLPTKSWPSQRSMQSISSKRMRAWVFKWRPMHQGLGLNSPMWFYQIGVQLYTKQLSRPEPYS